jgi:hypothetical protein
MRGALPIAAERLYEEYRRHEPLALQLGCQTLAVQQRLCPVITSRYVVTPPS